MVCQKIIGTSTLHVVDEDYTHKAFVTENIVKTIREYATKNDINSDMIIAFIDEATEREQVTL